MKKADGMQKQPDEARRETEILRTKEKCPRSKLPVAREKQTRRQPQWPLHG